MKNWENLSLSSLIPTVVELITFWEKNQPHTGWFPDWYLGVPYRFLTGPVVPGIVVLIRKIVPVPIEAIYFGLIGLMGVIGGGVGINFFCRQLGAGKQVSRLAGLLYILLPFTVWFLTFTSGLGNIAIGIVPWVWIFFQKSLKELMPLRKKIYLLASAFLTALVILINPSGILATAIGLLILVFLGNMESWVNSLLKLLMVLVLGISIATVWYSPRYWWILLGNPSFAGKPLANVIPFILQLVEAIMPIVLGAWVVQKRHKLHNKYIQFAVLFGASFFFLSFIRFLSDVDFWMDWIGYILELQVAGVMLLGFVLMRFAKLWILPVLVVAGVVTGVIVFKTYKVDVTNKSYKESIRKMVLTKISPDDRIFLSGSPVFWLNIDQVRGGKDDAATNPVWAMAAYQIREGEQVNKPISNIQYPISDSLNPIEVQKNDNAELLQDWLKILGVRNILVHGSESKEYFKDFKNLDRFTVLDKVAEENGDTLYSVDNSIARLADKQILKVPKPVSGNDYQTVFQYARELKQNISVKIDKPDEIEIATENPVNESEIISLAVTADPGWQIVQGEAELRSDNFGNIVLIPKSGNKWTIKYFEGWFWLPGVIMSIIMIIIVINNENIIGLVQNNLPSLSIGKEVNEEAEY